MRNITPHSKIGRRKDAWTFSTLHRRNMGGQGIIIIINWRY